MGCSVDEALADMMVRVAGMRGALAAQDAELAGADAAGASWALESKVTRAALERAIAAMTERAVSGGCRRLGTVENGRQGHEARSLVGKACRSSRTYAQTAQMSRARGGAPLLCGLAD